MSESLINKKIGLMSAIIICMNAMIGAGIFSTPAKLAISVGPAGLLAYIFAIIAIVLIALSLARVAQFYPQEGSFYTYTKQWGGHLLGLMAGGAYVLGVVIALGLLTQLASAYLSEYVTFVSPNYIGYFLIAGIVALNMVGVRFMQAGQFFLIGCTLFSLICTIIICFMHANFKNLIPFMPHGIGSVASAVKTAVFAFLGFESAASLFSIVENPKKNVPKALVLSILFVGLLYMTFISSINLAIPTNIFTSERMPLSKAILDAFPGYSWLGHVIGFSIITALLGVLQSMMYSVSTLTFSFFKLMHNKFAQEITSSKFGFQIILIAIGLFTLFNFIAVNNMDLFFSLTAVFVVFAFICSIITLIAKHHDKTITEKIITFLALICAAAIFSTGLKDLINNLV